eukprot:1880573-Rhodomonas_salina.2
MLQPALVRPACPSRVSDAASRRCPSLCASAPCPLSASTAEAARSCLLCCGTRDHPAAVCSRTAPSTSSASPAFVGRCAQSAAAPCCASLLRVRLGEGPGLGEAISMASTWKGWCWIGRWSNMVATGLPPMSASVISFPCPPLSAPTTCGVESVREEGSRGSGLVLQGGEQRCQNKATVKWE